LEDFLFLPKECWVILEATVKKMGDSTWLPESQAKALRRAGKR